jgi:hypothetical protein
MKDFLKVGLWSIAGSTAAFALLAVVVLWLKPEEYSLPSSRDIRQHLNGRWDWGHHTNLCSDSTHFISFQDSGRIMVIRQQNQWVDSLGRDRTATVYDLQSVTQSRVRGKIRGEERMMADGTPAVWDLVLFGSDEYRWQRTDWSAGQFTNKIVRCEDRAVAAGRF